MILSFIRFVILITLCCLDILHTYYRFDEGILKVTNGYDAAEFIEKE